MNRKCLAVVIVGIAGLSAFAVNQSRGQPESGGAAASNGSVAVVDLIRLFNELAQIQDLNDRMKQMADEYSKEATQRRRVIDDKQTQMTAYRPGSPDYVRLRKDLVRLNIDANVWLKVAEQQMEQDKFDWTRVIYDQIVQTVQAVARERGFEIVLTRSEFKPDEIEQDVQSLRRVLQGRVVIYNRPEIDITGVVLSRMNADYKKAGGKKQLDELMPLPGEGP